MEFGVQTSSKDRVLEQTYALAELAIEEAEVPQKAPWVDEHHGPHGFRPYGTSTIAEITKERDFRFARCVGTCQNVALLTSVSGRKHVSCPETWQSEIPMTSIYYAHSGIAADRSDWQRLAEHLRNAGEKAQGRAAATGALGSALAEAAFVVGLLHDLGKYRIEFQEYIRNLRSKGDPLTFHKQAGAARAFFHFKHHPIALAVMGHHGGIPDGSAIKANLRELAGEPTAQIVWPDAIRDCPELAALALTVPILAGFHADLFTRVLFSCLVDADWSDTGEHENNKKKSHLKDWTFVQNAVSIGGNHGRSMFRGTHHASISSLLRDCRSDRNVDAPGHGDAPDSYGRATAALFRTDD